MNRPEEPAALGSADTPTLLHTFEALEQYLRQCAAATAVDYDLYARLSLELADRRTDKTLNDKPDMFTVLAAQDAVGMAFGPEFTFGPLGGLPMNVEVYGPVLMLDYGQRVRFAVDRSDPGSYRISRLGSPDPPRAQAPKPRAALKLPPGLILDPGPRR